MLVTNYAKCYNLKRKVRLMYLFKLFNDKEDWHLLKKMSKKELLNKTVLVRCDFNVPLDEKGNIQSTKRIDATIPTINFLLNSGCKVILCSHMGRPQGKKDKSLSLKCVADYLSFRYPNKVYFCDKLSKKDIDKAKATAKNGEIVLLENLRFDTKEEENDKEFAGMLASNVDAFVDEAFATSHRQCASNNAILDFLPAYYGLNYLKEIKALTLSDKERPILALLGGAKVSDKITLIDNLIDKVDEIFIGGALANTFLYAQNYKINPATVEKDKTEVALMLIEKCKKANKKLFLPTDFIVLNANNEIKYKKLEDLETTDFCYDIGEDTIKKITQLIDKKSGTIFWNGPFSKTSDERFCAGSKAVAEALAKSNCYTIVGGGDSEGVLKKYNLTNKINFVSTGGGASLKYIQRG